MKFKIIKRHYGHSIFQIETKKYCISILFWVSGKWDKWQIKKGFYVNTIKMHPIEFSIYF